MLISIITPCLNRAGFIAEAVESVLQQNDATSEHIVMDGGSIDGTLDVLSRYTHLRVFSQPDKGIYDAINKGLQKAHGDVVGLLNTDDLYEPGIFGVIASTFANNPEIDAVVGGASIFTDRPEGARVTLAEFPCVAQNELLWRATVGAPVFNAWFFRKRLCDELGGFDLSYLYVADRDFLIRMALQRKRYASLDRAFYKYRMHPGSYTLSGSDSGEAPFMFECRSLAEKYIHANAGTAVTKCFKEWHSQIVNEQIWTAYRKRGFSRLAWYMLVGLRYNARWPVLFMKKVFERLAIFLSSFRRTNQDNSLPVG